MRNSGSRWMLLAALAAMLVTASPQLGRAAGIPAGKPGADYVPEETLLLLELPDVSATLERLKENALVKVYNDAGVQQYLQPVLLQVQGGKGMVDQQMAQNVGLTLADLGKIFSGRVTLALTGFTLGGGQPSVKAVLMLAPKDTEHLKATVAKFVGAMPPNVQQQLVKRQAHGAELSEIQIPNFPVAWTVTGNTFVLAVGPQAADDVLQRMAGAPARNLSGDANYKTVADKMAPFNQDWMCYLSFDRPVRLIRALAPQTAGRVMDYLGLEQIKSVGMAAKCAGPAIDDILYVYAPGESRLMKALVPDALDPALMKAIPATANSFAASRIDLAAIYALVMGTLEQAMPLQKYQEMQQQIQAINQQLGISLKDDLIGALGGQWGVYGLPLDEAAVVAKIKAAIGMEAKQMALMDGTYSSIVALNVPRNAARLDKGLKAALTFAMATIRQQAMNNPQLQAMALEEITVGGATGQILKGIPKMTLTPCYVVAGKYLIVAGSVEALKQAVAGIGGADITTAAFYKKGAAYIPEGAGGVSVSDPMAGMDLAGFSIQNTLQSLGEMGIRHPLLNALAMQDPRPLVDAMKKHMFVPVFAVKGEGNSLIVTAHSPYGGASTLSVAVVTIGAGVAVPRVFMQRRAVNRMQPVAPMPMPQ